MEMEIDSKWTTTTTAQSTAQYSSHCEWGLTEPLAALYLANARRRRTQHPVIPSSMDLSLGLRLGRTARQGGVSGGWCLVRKNNKNLGDST